MNRSAFGAIAMLASVSIGCSGFPTPYKNAEATVPSAVRLAADGPGGITDLANQLTTKRQDVGRFQIVNGTPGVTANIMLLDTVTGESWLLCPGTGGNEDRLWCQMRLIGPGPDVAPAPKAK